MKKSFWISMLFLATVGAAFAQDAVAAEDVIEEVTAPGIIPDIVRWVGDSYLSWTVGAAATIIVIVQVLKTLLAAFGASLKGRWIWVANATVGLLTVVGSVLADGKLDGGSELWALVAGLVAVVAAGFGYRVLFSETARVIRDNQTE